MSTTPATYRAPTPYDSPSTQIGPAGSPVRRGPRDDVPALTFTALVRVEFVKMFNTRSGFWLMASIAILSVLASGAVILFGGENAITYANFSAAVGMPIAILLPMLAILSVTSEWSQRTGLTTFTLVPHRGRVITGKALVTVSIGIVGILVAMGVGALGNLLGAAVHDIDPVWEFGFTDLLMVMLANVLGMLMGFTLGVVLRNSPAAIVGYFVYSLILPNVFGALAFYQESFADVWPWVDQFYNVTSLFERVPSDQEWVQLAVTTVIWMGVPLLVGLRFLFRSEIK
ncbi:ABC transporter permease subunit [Nocardioides gilvus]|uniref:ABC transporter permease subunit n=1 Tax=Nocardioides gilvus TaxID=1735589 RepID=UPI000D747C52|nr:ABC transporter permease subunit [Nocardioides gilvus]